MKITKRQNNFFDLIENGHSVSDSTAKLAKVGPGWVTVLRNLGLTTDDKQNAKYTGPLPIDRQFIKECFVDYNKELYRINNERSKQNGNGHAVVVVPRKRPLSEYSDADLLDEMRRRGFEGEILPPRMPIKL